MSKYKTTIDYRVPLNHCSYSPLPGNIFRPKNDAQISQVVKSHLYESFGTCGIQYHMILEHDVPLESMFIPPEEIGSHHSTNNDIYFEGFVVNINHAPVNKESLEYQNETIDDLLQAIA